MTVTTFDTLKFARKLKEAGITQQQAEAHAEALVEAFAVNLADLATKNDLKELELRIEAQLLAFKVDFNHALTELEMKINAQFHPIKSELLVLKSELFLLKWMMGFMLAGMVSLLVKTFFFS